MLEVLVGGMAVYTNASGEFLVKVKKRKASAVTVWGKLSRDANYRSGNDDC
jgi:hypothetical protein